MKIHKCFVNRETWEVVNPQTVEERQAQAREMAQMKAEAERARQKAKARRQQAAEKELARYKAYIETQQKAWEIAAETHTRKLFNRETGRVEEIPDQKSGAAMHGAFLDALSRGVRSIDISAPIITRGKINIELVNKAESYLGLETDPIPFKIKESLVETDDPPFPVSNKTKVYRAFHNNGEYRFYALEGNTLYLAVNSKGEPVKGGEGYKAQQARLELEAKAAAEEKANAAKLEAERAELERQEKQLEQLKKLPAGQFEKLMQLLSK